MKELSSFTNEDKARIIHQLLPHNIKSLLNYVLHYSEKFIENLEEHRKSWNENPIIGFDAYEAIIKRTIAEIDQYEINLLKNARIFSEQLFGGFNAIYLNHCMLQYAEEEYCPKNMQRAILLFFDNCRN